MGRTFERPVGWARLYTAGPFARGILSVSHPSPELEPSAAEMRRLVEAALERIVAHIESLPRQPAADVDGAAELARSLSAAAARGGPPVRVAARPALRPRGAEELQHRGPGIPRLHPRRRALPHRGRRPHRRRASTATSACGRRRRRWSSSRRTSCAGSATSVGYPRGGRAASSPAAARSPTSSALVTARRERLPEDFLRGVIYASDQAHHSVAEGGDARRASPRGNVRARAPRTSASACDLGALAGAVAADRAAGLTPFLAGRQRGHHQHRRGGRPRRPSPTCARRGPVAPRGRRLRRLLPAHRARAARRSRGIERADSVTLDPHKGLFLPYGTGSPARARRRRAAPRARAARGLPAGRCRRTPGFVDFSRDLARAVARRSAACASGCRCKMRGARGLPRAPSTRSSTSRRWAAAELETIPGVEMRGRAAALAAGLPPDAARASTRPSARRPQPAAPGARSTRRRRVYLTGTIARGRLRGAHLRAVVPHAPGPHGGWRSRTSRAAAEQA